MSRLAKALTWAKSMHFHAGSASGPLAVEEEQAGTEEAPVWASHHNGYRRESGCLAGSCIFRAK
jgi:hypothetical protein